MRKVFYFLSIVVLFNAAFTYSEEKEYFGEYIGTVQTQWLQDGRLMKLLSEFKYKDPNGLIWIAKKDSVVDGASIPQVAWSFIGSPFTGKYRDASVIHDIACKEKRRAWESVHLSFYYAMRASDVNVLKAKIMYAAVYYYGPRWKLYKAVRGSECEKRGGNCEHHSEPIESFETLDEKSFQKLIEDIEQKNIPLEAIREWKH